MTIPGEQVVVGLGDSITAGWNFLATNLKPYINAGIAGNTAEQMLVRFRRDVVEAGATIVAILGGINDIGAIQGFRTNEEILRALTSMYDIAAANKIAVVVCSLTPDREPYTATHPMSRIVAVNVLLAEYAAAHNLVYCDYHTPLLDSTGLLAAVNTIDGIHMAPPGYAIMARCLEQALQRVIGEG